MFKVYYFTTASGRNPVKEFIDRYDHRTRAKLLAVIEYLEHYGFHLETKYLHRMRGTKTLWELRIAYAGNQYRIFLAKIGDKEIALLHAIVKKTQKVPRKEIDVAEKRFLEMMAA